MYAAMAGVYHLLFPAREAQLEFLAALAGAPPARAVDVACGTGEYVAALLARGYDASGVELDATMLAAGLKRHPELAGAAQGGGGAGALRLLQGDMLDLFDVTRGPYALAYCIGNSLPHLASDVQVAETLSQLWDLTRPAGAVCVQVVNFDRVLAQMQAGAGAGGQSGHAGFAMPPMSIARADGAAVEFSRGYTPAGEGRVLFRTQLRIGEERHVGETPLLTLTRARLEAALPRGVQAAWYGDYDSRAWSAEAPATILVFK